MSYTHYNNPPSLLVMQWQIWRRKLNTENTCIRGLNVAALNFKYVNTCSQQRQLLEIMYQPALPSENVPEDNATLISNTWTNIWSGVQTGLHQERRTDWLHSLVTWHWFWCLRLMSFFYFIFVFCLFVFLNCEAHLCWCPDRFILCTAL